MVQKTFLTKCRSSLQSKIRGCPTAGGFDPDIRFFTTREWKMELSKEAVFCPRLKREVFSGKDSAQNAVGMPGTEVGTLLPGYNYHDCLPRKVVFIVSGCPERDVQNYYKKKHQGDRPRICSYSHVGGAEP